METPNQENKFPNPQTNSTPSPNQSQQGNESSQQKPRSERSYYRGNRKNQSNLSNNNNLEGKTTAEIDKNSNDKPISGENQSAPRSNYRNRPRTWNRNHTQSNSTPQTQPSIPGSNETPNVNRQVEQNSLPSENTTQSSEVKQERTNYGRNRFNQSSRSNQQGQSSNRGGYRNQNQQIQQNQANQPNQSSQSNQQNQTQEPKPYYVSPNYKGKHPNPNRFSSSNNQAFTTAKAPTTPTNISTEPTKVTQQEAVKIMQPETPKATPETPKAIQQDTGNRTHKYQDNRKPYSHNNTANRGYRSNQSTVAEKPTTPTPPPPPVPKAPKVETPKPPVTIPIPSNVQRVCQLLGIKTDVLMNKMQEALNITLTPTQQLDATLIETIALQFNREIKIRKIDGQELPRAPIVTFMGHVNHGKTSLLDCVRNSHIADHEAGGITQHIGAYKITYNGQDIVFLDTPGHEAFTKMRARGANVTDMVILVVAIDDGVKPQTLEAIDHARAAGISDDRIIVAVNKIDKPGIDRAKNIDKIMHELAAKKELNPEKWSGNTIYVPVSAQTKEGIDELLSSILLLAEMHELRANPKLPASGSILESRVVEGKGTVASIIVQNGTLKEGDPFFCGRQFGTVRTITNHLGENIKEAGPSTPIEISGFNSLPEVGEKFIATDTLKAAKLRAEEKDVKIISQPITGRMSREDMLKVLLEQRKESKSQDLKLILKTDVQGSLEAIQGKLRQSEYTEGEIKINILHASVGPITESDVNLADSNKAVIVGFNVMANSRAEELAIRRGVQIRRHNVIYQLLREVKSMMSGMLTPEIKEEISGHCIIRKVIQISSVGNIAGCYVTDGCIERSSQIRLYRGGILVNKDKPLTITSLKHVKKDMTEVKKGLECGIKLDYEDIKESDEMEAFKNISVQRTLE